MRKFTLATSVAELRPEFSHPTAIVGTVAYLAPEATGRTGRAVDQRGVALDILVQDRRNATAAKMV